MAVSIDDQLSNQELKFPANNDTEKNCDDSSRYGNTVAKSEKRERRKPELQIYRPGRGLQNKSSKAEDDKKSNFESIFNPRNDSPTSESPPNFAEEKSNSVCESVKSTKNTKSRRPDIQVYMPKAKLNASRLNDRPSSSMNDSSSKWEEEESEISWKKSSSHCDRHKSMDAKVKTQSVKTESNGVKSSKPQSSKDSESPLNSKSWADCVEEHLSNSRSSPEDQLCNGYSDSNVHLHLSNAFSDKKIEHNNKSNHKSGKDDQRWHRNKKGNKQREISVTNVGEKRKHNDVTKNLSGKDSVNQKQTDISTRNLPGKDSNSQKQTDVSTRNLPGKDSNTQKQCEISSRSFSSKESSVQKQSDTSTRNLPRKDLYNQKQSDMSGIDSNCQKQSNISTRNLSGKDSNIHKQYDTRNLPGKDSVSQKLSDMSSMNLSGRDSNPHRQSDASLGKINKSLDNAVRLKEKKTNTNSLDRGKMKQRENSVTSIDNRGYMSEFNDSSNANLHDVKQERKKHDKDFVLPPRFQKQKLQNSDSSSSVQSRCGGILKLPVDHDHIDPPLEMLEKLHIPKVYPEPPKMFIPKLLFDPNNPSKPEIVNIPAPIPPPHVPYPKVNHMLYASDSLNSHYIPAPVEGGPYIPPPQPPKASPHYQFMQPGNICANNVLNGYLDMSGSSPPIHAPQMNGIFPTPHSYSDVVPVNQAKRRLKPIVEKNLHEIVMLEKELTSVLAKGLMHNLNSLKQCRWKLQLRYENIILADPKYCAEKNPEQTLWKTVYHHIIETYRKQLEDNPNNSEEIKETLLNIILEGTMFYENLLEKQQETYGFKLSKLLETEHLNTSLLSDQLRCVLISVQKNLIYLGDLARYKEQISQTSNYGKARSWYLKAQQIAPKNGKPYHQLALLALNTRRRLDAVYYYMRSLAASNPFLSAKESLLSLFEEAKRKYESYEKKRVHENTETEVFEDQATERYEVWIKNDGSSTERPAEVGNTIDACDLKKLTDVELNKRFVTSFLHVHGKLFTKVGMESFPDTLNNMLKEFYFLLQRSPLPLNSARLLQLLAINIFSVTNSALKEHGREQGGRSLLQEQALYASMAMMSLLMDRCCLLHVAHKSLPEYSSNIISDDFGLLLPSIKIWTDWMSCQRYLWPPPSPQLVKEINVQVNNNIWVSFANLLSVLQEIDITNPVIVTHNTSNSECIILEEDITFAGFVPLLGSIQNPAYAILPYDKDKARHCLRISKIQFFGDYLCGVSPPYLEFDVGSKCFVALLENLSYEETYERSVLLSSEDSFREEHLNDKLQEDSTNRTSVSNELSDLWSRKEALSKAREEQQKYQARVQAVLHKHQCQRPIVLKIKPRYLVPDTNCFIDHLKLFKNILASTDFHLIIPLVVINELDGLARGSRGSEHSSRVTALSRETILFLEQQFASRHPHLRAITSKGSILDTISFRSEEMGQNKGTNDDLILTCCLFYCKDRAENFMPKNPDDPITLFREVVLLTDDRNLRVKALAHHVPVRDLLSFLQWTNS